VTPPLAERETAPDSKTMIGVATASPEKRKGARELMIYAVISVFVMVSLWGLVRLLAATFGVDFIYPDVLP
jgi:predicted secreted protein